MDDVFSKPLAKNGMLCVANVNSLGFDIAPLHPQSSAGLDLANAFIRRSLISLNCIEICSVCLIKVTAFNVDSAGVLISSAVV